MNLKKKYKNICLSSMKSVIVLVDYPDDLPTVSNTVGGTCYTSTTENDSCDGSTTMI